jgi:uncharacterized protein YyaL (SSP411 family)
MFRRKPAYSVTTFALVFIAVAAFGVRYAARFLPERQPNDLKMEYGEYARRSMRETVQWHPFGAPAFARAEELGKIVFLDIGTVISLSAKRFSEDYATDGEYRRLLHDHFEPIKIDALEMPWIVEALSIETGSFLRAGRFMAVTTDPRGGIVEWSAIRPKSGDGSLATWLEYLARLRYADLDAVATRARRSHEERPQRAVAALNRGPCDIDVVKAWADVWQHAVAGGLSNNWLPVWVLPAEVLALSNSEQGDIGSLNFLLDLALSPSFDAIDGGFFVFAEDGHWRLPVGAKLTGHSLQLAAAYAEVGVDQDVPLFRQMAVRTSRWAANQLTGGLFRTALGTDQLLDGSSPYYGFSEGEVEGEPFRVGDWGFPRIQALSGFASNVTQQRTAEVFAAADRLAALRKGRQIPRADPTTYANQNGQVISGLFRIGAALKDEGSVELAETAYTQAVSTFVQPLGDVLHAPIIHGGTTSYAGSYTWMARAAIDGYLATGNDAYLRDAELITERMLELFRGDSGALMAYLPSLLENAGFDLEVYLMDDADLSSSNAVAALNLADLAAITGKAPYRQSAEGIIRAFSGNFATSMAPPGLVLAGLRLYVSPIRPLAKP